ARSAPRSCGSSIRSTPGRNGSPGIRASFTCWLGRIEVPERAAATQTNAETTGVLDPAPPQREREAESQPGRDFGVEQAIGNRGASRAAEAGSAPMVVDDDAAPADGQMRKAPFMAALRQAICATADEGLAAAGRTSRDCPWIEFWMR